MKTLKHILRFILGIKPKPRTVNKKNLRLPVGRMRLIHKWENHSDEITIRSTFNRELYYKYLKELEA